MRGFWWWERDAQVLEQIRLYREERLRQKQERREDRREKRDYVAIGIALFAAAFTCWQAWEAHQTRKDTQVQFEQAQRRADRDANQVRIDAKEAVDAQTKLADRSAEQAKQSADAAREQLKVAKDQAMAAKNSVGTVQLQMRLDQRAWVTVDVGEKTGNFAVSMKNTGRSPAINVTEVTAFGGGKRMGPPDVDLSQNSSSPVPLPQNAPKELLETLKKEGYIRDRPPTGYVIAPGATQIASDYQGKFTQIFRIEGDRVYIQGRVTYDDVFGSPHETIFCYWFAPPSDFVMCNDHNRMN
jgi:hypothetical protein